MTIEMRKGTISRLVPVENKVMIKKWESKGYEIVEPEPEKKEGGKK